VRKGCLNGVKLRTTLRSFTLGPTGVEGPLDVSLLPSPGQRHHPSHHDTPDV